MVSAWDDAESAGASSGKSSWPKRFGESLPGENRIEREAIIGCVSAKDVERVRGASCRLWEDSRTSGWGDAEREMAVEGRLVLQRQVMR